MIRSIEKDFYSQFSSFNKTRFKRFKSPSDSSFSSFSNTMLFIFLFFLVSVDDTFVLPRADDVLEGTGAAAVADDQRGVVDEAQEVFDVLGLAQLAQQRQRNLFAKKKQTNKQKRNEEIHFSVTLPIPQMSWQKKKLETFSPRFPFDHQNKQVERIGISKKNGRTVCRLPFLGRRKTIRPWTSATFFLFFFFSFPFQCRIQRIFEWNRTSQQMRPFFLLKVATETFGKVLFFLFHSFLFHWISVRRWMSLVAVPNLLRHDTLVKGFSFQFVLKLWRKRFFKN